MDATNAERNVLAEESVTHAASNFDLQPTLSGETIALRPVHADDFETLYAAASDPLIWEQHPEPLRYQKTVFAGFFASALASGGALVVIDKPSGTVIGSSRYYDWNPDTTEVAIGYTFLARSHWGGSANREMKQLMLGHAFLFAKVVWFHVGTNNWRSRRAMEKLGGQMSHEASVESNGIAHDYAFYRIDAPGPRHRKDENRRCH
ncbi:MAG: RimJ/RimL family protein N-acetyltransferase [Candidatus Accumulibacter regalis]